MKGEHVLRRLVGSFDSFGTRSSPSRGDHDLNPDMQPDGSLRAAAVLVPLVWHPDQLTVLLTQRTDTLSNHAGQISFPGGHMEEGDSCSEDTALRETEEEVGIPRERIEIVGRLDQYITRTGFSITPVVGMIRPPVEVQADPVEVADVFEVPLTFLMDPTNHVRDSRIYKGRKREFYAMPYEERYIWGATAGMIMNLYDVLRD